jgi:RNA polymerase sigma-70 factor (ECF subfamily)
MQQVVQHAGIQKERAISADPQMTTDLSHHLSLVAMQQDKAAFTILFKHFAPKIIRFGVSKLGSEVLAKELLQETMSKVWRKAHLYHTDKGAATTWVYTIMRNAAFDMLRKTRAQSEQSLADDLWPLDALEEGVTHEPDSFRDHLLSKQLRAHIDKLPDKQRTVVQGVYFQELSQEQLAQQLDVPIGTIKSRLRLALERLKQHMESNDYD